MRPWLPVALVLALVAVPAAAAQPSPRLETSTHVLGPAVIEVAPGGTVAADLEVVYRYRPVPSTVSTPTAVSGEEADPGIHATVSPSTVFHPVEVRGASGTMQESVKPTQLVVAADENATGQTLVTVEAFSDENGVHGASEGSTRVLVDVSSVPSGGATTQSDDLSEASEVPAVAGVGLVAAGLLAAALARGRRW